jgi:hypothetical protein
VEGGNEGNDALRGSGVCQLQSSVKARRSNSSIPGCLAGWQEPASPFGWLLRCSFCGGPGSRMAVTTKAAVEVRVARPAAAGARHVGDMGPRH